MNNKTRIVFSFVALIWFTIVYSVHADTTEVKKGTYTVPAITTDSAKFSFFATDFTVTKDDDGKISLSYTLPQDVVGLDSFKVSLTQKGEAVGAFIHLEGGNNDEAQCRRAGENLTCLVAYPTLNVPLETVGNFLSAKYKNSPDNDLRMKLSRFFANDPRGIVNF